jgi:hypothetical protein
MSKIWKTLVLASMVGTAFDRPLTKADVDAWLDGYLSNSISSGDIPGGVVVVVSAGQLLTARGFGYAGVPKHVLSVRY